MKKLFIIILFIIIGFCGSGCNKENGEYKYTVEDIEVTTGNLSLDGKLTTPITKEKVPAVVMVHGSGPLDMDSTVNKLKPFKDLAEGLANKGIASIRYDKVTYTHLNEVATNYDFTIYDETVYDALSAVKLLKEDSRIDSNNIFILGHSLGGQLAPIILNEEPSINGAIMMAGTPRHILDLLMDQIKEQDENYHKEVYPIYKYIKNLEEVVPGQEKYLYFGAYQKYWVNYNKINIEEETKSASQNHPLLIMQGGLDIQVPKSTIDLYKNILKDSSNIVYKEYELLNHCFDDGQEKHI
ncbi:MAG TPA: prolyl oligopeptidase family serine peptidase [Acholeplasmataceae bacterium]|jgi:dienelactone hydrolase|nr:prolyl oligopeptidase family serine peptidase [Acholeplasmataceae bacterium]